MSIARQLYQLQEIDLELETAEQSLARIIAQIGESPQVIKARRELEQETSSLEGLKKQQREAEQIVDDLSIKISAIEEKLYGGRINNPKELSGFQQEGDILKEQRSREEDKALELLDQIAESEERVAALTGNLRDLEAGWQVELANLEAGAERDRTQIAELQDKRLAVAAGIDPAAVASYDIIRQQKGRAVARVERGACRSCGISLSTAQQQQARGNDLMRCPNCGRILFHV